MEQDALMMARGVDSDSWKLALVNKEQRDKDNRDLISNKFLKFSREHRVSAFYATCAIVSTLGFIAICIGNVCYSMEEQARAFTQLGDMYSGIGLLAIGIATASAVSGIPVIVGDRVLNWVFKCHH